MSRSRIVITLFFAALGALIALPAVWPHQADRSSPVAGVVVGKESDDGTCLYCTGLRIYVRDSHGHDHTVTVSQQVYDSCWIDAFNPDRYPECARRATGGAR